MNYFIPYGSQNSLIDDISSDFYCLFYPMCGEEYFISIVCNEKRHHTSRSTTTIYRECHVVKQISRQECFYYILHARKTRSIVICLTLGEGNEQRSAACSERTSRERLLTSSGRGRRRERAPACESHDGKDTRFTRCYYLGASCCLAALAQPSGNN